MHMYLNELSSLEFAPWLFFVGWPAVFEPGAVFWHSLTACLENKKKGGLWARRICEFSAGSSKRIIVVVVLILEVSHEKTLIAVSPPSSTIMIFFFLTPHCIQQGKKYHA